MEVSPNLFADFLSFDLNFDFVPFFLFEVLHNIFVRYIQIIICKSDNMNMFFGELLCIQDCIYISICNWISKNDNMIIIRNSISFYLKYVFV